MLVSTVTSPAVPGLVGSAITAARGAASARAGSTFGPAYLLGGSSTSFNQGLYNAQGLLIGEANARLSQASKATTARAAKQRKQQLERITARMDAGDIKGGREEAERLLAKNPQDVTLIRLVAHSYLAEQNYASAERSFVRALVLDPNNARVRSELDGARILQQGDDEVLRRARRKLESPSHRRDGLRLLSRLSERSPRSADVYLAFADGFTAARRPREALLALSKAVELADRKQLDEVISRAETMARKHRSVGLPHNILGRAYQKAGRLDRAIAELKAATGRAPNNLAYVSDLADAYVSRADANLAGGNVESAGADLIAAQSIDPTNSKLATMRGRLAAHRAGQDVVAGRYSSALKKLEAARFSAASDANLKANVAGLYLTIGHHYRKEGADATALKSYTAALELDPDSISARLNVGQVAHRKGLSALAAKDYDLAVTDLRLAYETYSYNETYRKDLANGYDQRGQQKLSLGEIDEAIEDFRTGYRLDPSNSSLETNLSNALAQQT